MLIQILSLSSVTAIFSLLAVLVWLGARKEPPPRAEPLTAAKQATMRVGLMLTRLIVDPGSDGRTVRAAGDQVGVDEIADAISSVPPVLIVKMTDEELRAHIVRSCRSRLSGYPYRTLN